MNAKALTHGRFCNTALYNAKGLRAISQLKLSKGCIRVKVRRHAQQIIGKAGETVSLPFKVPCFYSFQLMCEKNVFNSSLT